MSSPNDASLPLALAFDDARLSDARALRSELGNKALGLVEMAALGLPVPAGFVVRVEAGRQLLAGDAAHVDAAVDDALRQLEETTGKSLGDPMDPLLVSVRSGAAVSMPGMMDSVLNVGLTRAALVGLSRTDEPDRFAFDAYRRLLAMWGEIVSGLGRGDFDDALSRIKRDAGVRRGAFSDASLGADALSNLCAAYEEILKVRGASLPDDPHAQLRAAVRAVYASWDNPRARRFRAQQGIDESLGTACIVQAMVYGNRDERSGSGVAFTRDPSSGERCLYGEYLASAQGEDVVSGVRTPASLTRRAAVPGREDRSLEASVPEAFVELSRIAERLEDHYRDVQDIEFTIEGGRPYVLQTRRAKRTPEADVRFAVAFVEEDRLTREGALARIDAEGVSTLKRPRLPSPETLLERGIKPLAIGLAASPGGAAGRIVFSPEAAERMAAEGQDVILVRRDTTPEDVLAMKGARAILTAAGGLTSHAAVLSRALGKCCVAGASTLRIDYQEGTLTARPRRGAKGDPITLKVGDTITVDGATGRIYQGALDVVAASALPELDTILGWADERRRVEIRANADTPRDVRAAASFGAAGIGLCRTEHMFFADERLGAIRCVVLAGDEAERGRWVKRIEAMQRGDFEEIFEAMDGRPVTIRLLDMPLHEFMPRDDRGLEIVARALGVSMREARRRAGNRHEVNPMIGHRGVRVGLTIPAVYEAQIRAVLSAAIAVKRRGGDVHPELLIPLVAAGEEVRLVSNQIRSVAAAVFDAEGEEVAYRVGTMIELPRACLRAAELAQHVDFLSFGTNDLTQTTFGISRDDSEHFIPTYIDELRVLPLNPFRTIDEDGVGELIQMAVERARAVKPEIEVGVCGQQGADARSAAFFASIGVDYVSSAPDRIAVARLAYAQAQGGAEG